MAFLDLDHVRLFFTDEHPGTAPDADPLLPLVFVHGYTADSHDWSWQLAHFGASRRVVAVDLRGHGASGVPVDGCSTELFVADLLALLEHLELERVVLVGHSMGAIVASVAAVEHPGRVAGIVAVDPAYLVDDAVAGAIGPLLDGLADPQVVPFVQSIVGDAMDTPGRDPALRTWQVRRIAAMDPRVLRQTLAGQVSGMALRSASEPYLPRRGCPVLAFHADPQRGALEAELLADPRSCTVVWEGAGHWLHQERPDEFNARVSDWLHTLDA
jgi:pimeloyl-ACP methyl ester carboxylesterase